MFGIFSKKHKQPTYVGPLNIDLITSLIKSGVLKNEPSEKGQLVKLDNGEFFLCVLELTWRWTDVYTAPNGLHAAKYKVDGKAFHIPFEPKIVKSILDAAHEYERSTLDKVLEYAQSMHSKKIAEQL